MPSIPAAKGSGPGVKKVTNTAAVTPPNNVPTSRCQETLQAAPSVDCMMTTV